MKNWSVELLQTVDSTNLELRRREAAPHGTVLVARHQTSGRGRLGRTFSSPHGVYFSALLRRTEPPEQLLHLTAMTAVAVRRALLDACGVDTRIKWVNDLLLGEKKLGGILVETTGDGRYIIGIGINCNTDYNDLPPELRQTAAVIRGDEETLILALVRSLAEMDENLLQNRSAWMQEYAEHCCTVGREVRLLRGDEVTEAFATGVAENGALLVRYSDGTTAAVRSGEASVRGRFGYI